jgi:hypothetical protein
MAGGVSTQMLNFTGGKNTEAGKFGAAPNTAETLVNFELQANGSVTRRLGVADTGTDISLFARSETWLLSAATSTYEWRGAGAEGDLTINVVQFGSILSLFGAASVNIDLSSYAIDASFGEHKFSYASGLGYLFVTSKYLRPIYIKLNSNNTFTTTAIKFKIRDFTGVDDGLDVDERPTTLSDEHEYNLRNQGWPTEFQCVLAMKDPLVHTYQHLGRYPSNADILFYNLRDQADDSKVIGSFDGRELQKSTLGTTQAPRGHYILDAFSPNRQAVSGIAVSDSSLYEGSITTRPTSCAFFYGRLFVGGLADPGHTGKIFVSRLVESTDDFGKCYQHADPTAEDINALVATDGLVLKIHNCGAITAMRVLGDSILVFATNGVWAIAGGSDTGFTAEAFVVNKVSDAGTSASGSVVATDSAVLYWSDRGIYSCAYDPSDGSIVASNISLDTIHSDYGSIGTVERNAATGFYDYIKNRVYWFYYSGTDAITSGVPLSKCDYALVLDLRLQAFYDLRFYDATDLTSPYTISPYVFGAFMSNGATLDTTPRYENVTDSALTDIVDSANDIVQIELPSRLVTAAQKMYLYAFSNEEPPP